MKKFVLLSLLCCYFCHSRAQVPIFFSTEYTSLAVPELFIGELSYLDPAKLTTQYKPVDGLKHDFTLLPSLSAAISTVTIYKQTTGGTLTIAGQSVSAKNEHYVVIYDFTQTQQVRAPQTDGSLVSGLIGISVRMTAKIYTKNKGINLANLFGIGLAASQDKLTGSLEVKVFGLSSQKINEIIPVTSDLSSSTIQNCLTSVATIKSHMYDPETRVSPYLLAFNHTGSGSANSKQTLSKDFNTISEELIRYSPLNNRPAIKQPAENKPAEKEPAKGKPADGNK